jgi:hypothetical protein
VATAGAYASPNGDVCAVVNQIGGDGGSGAGVGALGGDGGEATALAGLINDSAARGEAYAVQTGGNGGDGSNGADGGDGGAGGAGGAGGGAVSERETIGVTSTQQRTVSINATGGSGSHGAGGDGGGAVAEGRLVTSAQYNEYNALVVGGAAQGAGLGGDVEAFALVETDYEAVYPVYATDSPSATAVATGGHAAQRGAGGSALAFADGRGVLSGVVSATSTSSAGAAAASASGVVVESGVAWSVTNIGAPIKNVFFRGAEAPPIGAVFAGAFLAPTFEDPEAFVGDLGAFAARYGEGGGPLGLSGSIDFDFGAEMFDPRF